MNPPYNTLSFGKVCIQLEEVDSTNQYATQLLQQQPAPIAGTIVTTNYQYNGKGQRGNGWHSEAGKNMTISLILYPKQLFAHQQFALSQTIALGIYQFICTLVTDATKVRIKWPNDIYYENKKLGGILIENTIHGQHLSSSIVGIGLNINQIHFPSTLPNPISLSQITDIQYTISDLRKKLCHYLEVAYLRLKPANLTVIRKDYERVLYQFGKHAHYKTLTGMVYAKITGVNKTGQLVLMGQSQQAHYPFLTTTWQKEFGMKEVEFCLE